jgi:AcrR family transcriptional regulator
MDEDADSPEVLSRRVRRRRETIDEILGLSLEVIKLEGIAGLNLSAVAKRLGVQPTALYKYFPSLTAVYDALFRRALDSLEQELTAAMQAAPPGMAAIGAAIRSASKWASLNPELSQLLLWRPVAGYTPPVEALTSSSGVVMEMFAEALDVAAAAGEISPDIAGGRGAQILSVLLTGAVSVQFADFGSPWTHEDFTELVPDLIGMFASAYSPRGLQTSE